MWFCYTIKTARIKLVNTILLTLARNRENRENQQQATGLVNVWVHLFEQKHISNFISKSIIESTSLLTYCSIFMLKHLISADFKRIRRYKSEKNQCMTLKCIFPIFYQFCSTKKRKIEQRWSMFYCSLSITKAKYTSYNDLFVATFPLKSKIWKLWMEFLWTKC